MDKSRIYDIQIEDSIIFPYSIQEKYASNSNEGKQIYSDAKRIYKGIDDEGKPYKYWANYDDIYGADKLNIHSKEYMITIYNNGDLIIQKK